MYIHSWIRDKKKMFKYIPSGYGNTCCTFNFPLNKPMTNDFDSVD